MSFGIAGRTADSLNQGGFRTQEAFLVCVQNGHKRDLRNVQPFTEQVDPHQYVKDVQTHIPDDLRPLQGIHIGMQILDPDAHLPHIIRQVLGHPLGQRGHQHFVFLCHFFVHFADQVIDLALHRTHLHLRI